jgi:hypothetical protein
MNHLPYIISAYVIALGLPICLGIMAIIRLQTARHRLDTIGVRRVRGGG